MMRRTLAHYRYRRSNGESYPPPSTWMAAIRRGPIGLPDRRCGEVKRHEPHDWYNVNALARQLFPGGVEVIDAEAIGYYYCNGLGKAL